MGQQSLGEMNDNGERFVDLCATSNLVIGGSLFQHRRIHKETWISSDLQTEDQIELFKMCVSGEGQIWLQTTISWLHG